ncbi:MAG: c-type cytochrome [Gemmatimonadota bacterium]
MHIRTKAVFLTLCMLATAACSATDTAGEAAVPSVQEPTGPIDVELAAQGQELFQTRGCVLCHKVTEERLVGPGLAGITERRTFAWTYGMITNPDSMLAEDATAKELLGQYFTPMANQDIKDNEFRMLYEYMRSLDESRSEDSP